MALQAKKSPYQHSRHQKYLNKPKYKEMRYNRQKTKNNQVQKHRNHKVPSKGQRAEFSIDTKQQILILHGSVCFLCSSTLELEFHHVKFASKNGRGTFRNGVPLCHTCHMLVHEESPHGRDLAHYIRTSISSRFGRFYHMDNYDLYKLGYISSPTEELYERFMVNQEILARTQCERAI